MLRKSCIVVLLSLLLSVSIVYAKTITVDGDPSDWVASELIVDDNNADGGGGGLDIDTVYFTNDTTNAYFRIDTVGTVDFSGNNHISILLDSDNNTATGTMLAGLQGVDHWIAIDPGPTGCEATSSADIMVFSLPSFAISTTGLAFATSGSVLEVSAALTELNVTSNRSMPAIVHTSNSGGNCALATTDATSPAAFVIPGPTSVEVSSVSSQASSVANAPVIYLLLFVLLVGATAGALWQRRA